MQKLKTILASKIFYILSSIFIVLLILVKTVLIKYDSKYSDENTITGIVKNISISDDKIKLTIKAKEKIIANMYSKETPNISIGDKVELKGEICFPSNNTIPNTFNYKKYLYNNHIYNTFKVDKINIIKKNTNILNTIKNKLYKSITNPYIRLFIIGDKTLLDTSIYENYKDIGVAHLLAVSGMHVSVFILIINKILFFIPKKKREIFISLFLIFYSYIVNFTPSILRVVLFYIMGRIIPNLSNIKRLYLTFFIMILINPFFIYNVGFQYSFITVLGIILISKYLTNNYIKDIFIISFYSSVFTLPITVNLNYEINLLSVISNIILVPLVTFIIYPLSLLTLIIKYLEPIYNIFISIMEFISNFLNNIDILKINIPKMNILIIIIYYLILIISVRYNHKKLLYFLLMIIIFNKLIYKIDSNTYTYFIDVGQGDSTLIIYPYKKNVTLIDTGGKENYDVSKNTLLFLKSIGITKIEKIIITHGDSDHMKDAIYIINNFKVNKVYFNIGEYNELEKNLIKILNKKKIIYQKTLYSFENINVLYTGIYNNENDNSSVLYFSINNVNFLLMGDAGIEREKDILDKYNLKYIDFLKVGHHGSNTSSSKIFINSINPKYSLISVGKNNRYGHPKDEVLDTLKNSKIYRTDLDGSIEIKLNKNGYKIRTCPP